MSVDKKYTEINAYYFCQADLRYWIENRMLVLNLKSRILLSTPARN